MRWWTCPVLVVLITLVTAPRASTSGAEPAESDSLSRFMRSESKAFRYSLYTTLGASLTGILIIPGAILAPSAGYFYGGCPRQAWQGILLRCAIGGGALYWQSKGGNTDQILPIYASLTGVSAIYDIAKVRGAVRKRNQRVAEWIAAEGGAPFGEDRFVRRSEDKALHISLYGTLVPIGAGAVLTSWTGKEEYLGILGIGGIIVGPSFGYMYAGSPGRGLLGFVLRGTSVLIGAIGALGSMDDDTAWRPWAVGLSFAAGSAVYDLAHVRAQVRKNNRENPTDVSLGIVPIRSEGRTIPGLALWITSE